MTPSLNADPGQHTAARVALAFDLDGPTGSAMGSGTLWSRPGYFMLGAYGPYRAMPRILDILREAGAHATFFTPAWVVRHWPNLCTAILADGHEIAGHGDRHEMFYGRSREDQQRILSTSQETFDRFLGREAAGFRAPSGDWAPETAELLVEHGYRYSSTLRSGDRPFRHADLPLVEIPAKSLFDDYSAFAYHRAPNYPDGLDRIAPYAATFRSWREEISAAAEEGLTVATIWHPKVIGTPGRLILLEQLVHDLVRSDDVVVATCEEIARSVGAES